MKRLSISIILIAILFFPVMAQTTEEEIRSVLRDQVNAWNKGDLNGFMEGYWSSEEMLFISGITLTKGYEAITKRFSTSYSTPEKMGELAFEEISIRVLSAELALVHGIWKLNRKEDKPWGRFTLLVEKKPEGWRVTYDHTSSAPQ